MAKVYDCINYNGDFDLLEIRLHELARVVDTTVVFETVRMRAGAKEPLFLRTQWSQVKPFAREIRYVVVDDEAETAGAWDRMIWRRNSIMRGLVDVEIDDLVLVSDSAAVPNLESVRAAKQDALHQFYGFELAQHCLALNYRNSGGPKSSAQCTVGFKIGAPIEHTPYALREAVWNGDVPMQRLADAGWRFEGLPGGWQGSDSEDPLNDVDVTKIIAARLDPFGDEASTWELGAEDCLPDCVRENRSRFQHLLASDDGSFLDTECERKAADGDHGPSQVSSGHQDEAALPARAASVASPVGTTYESRREPIIVCPYVNDTDVARVQQAFGLNDARGSHLPFFFYKDEDLLGPEISYEHCWQKFPDRDVIIVHTDMQPLPDDLNNQWYDDLLRYADELPDAGLIACDLLYPVRAASGRWYVQSAGGHFDDGNIGSIGGAVDARNATVRSGALEYDDSYRRIREVDWVTFGGIYMRREILDMCGGFDNRYKWAYVKDVDYSLEARLRGLKLYQVPVNLLHEESGTTIRYLADPSYRSKVDFNFTAFHTKWYWFLQKTRKPQS